MADDDTTTLGGQEASQLTPSGDSIVQNPSLVERGTSTPTEAGVLSPPPVVDSTPTADGSTPQEERDAAARDAAAALADVPEQSADGRSPDPRLPSSAVGTGSGALSPETPDARRDEPISASREAAPARPGAPHYFVEQVHQVYYHDAIVYIEGENVSPFLTGAISVSYGLGTQPNHCDFTLDNAGHRFTLTPENIQNHTFRLGNIYGRDFDYDESIKRSMYDRKRRVDYNPIDPESGARRFPLHNWSPVIHKYDAVRVWIHNPASDADEWIPVFTGYIVNKPLSEDYISGSNTISISCEDIRHRMQKMRVNTNTVLAVLPSQQTGQQADPTNEEPFTGLRVFSPQANQAFNTSFFTDLVASSEVYDNPWVSLTFPALVAALTFVENAQSLINASSGAADQRAHSSTDAGRAFGERARGRQLAALASRISPLRLRVVDGGGTSVLTASEQGTYSDLLNQISQAGLSLQDIDTELGIPATQATSTDTATADQARDPGTVPVPPPSATGGGTTSSTATEATAAAEASTVSVAPPRGAGRIGRMRQGIFPLGDTIPSDVYYPGVSASRDAVRAYMARWYALALFSSPVRTNIVTSGLAEDGPVSYARVNTRYWREQEVHAAGRSTRREGAWEPDAQAVHMMLPGRQTPFVDNIFEVSHLERGNTAANLNWTNRLELICDAVERVDYRFYVSGSGDLIFEFAQYDFNPEDYGAWSSILTINHHLTHESFDEEGGEITTAVLATGSNSRTGLADVPVDGTVDQYIPVSVGIWSPSLASRHGLQIQVRNYPQIVDPDQLNRLAALEFQKLMAAADKYSIELAFRPWMLLNKPIFNQYRERYALIDGVSWTLPVTAGQVAGQNPPTCSLILNYTRSVDEVGVSRFITGGPSNPVFFGRRAGGERQLLQSLQTQYQILSGALRDLNSSTVSAETLATLHQDYNAILPRRQDIYNVINATLDDVQRADGEEDALVTTARSIDAQIAELTGPGAYGLSETERRTRLRALADEVEQFHTSLRERGSTPNPPRDAGGVAPDFGPSGVRSTLLTQDAPDSQPTPPTEPEATCSPGDPEMFSAPTGASRRTYPLWQQFERTLPRGRQRTVLLDAYARGQLPDSSVPRSAGTWQFADEFPRIVVSPFSQRGARGWHLGVDIPMDLGEPVYCVADGIVFNISADTGQGMGIGVLHANGFCTFYRHQRGTADGVELGALVKRNQILSYCGFSGTERRETMTHIHFETCCIYGSPAYERYVAQPPQRSSGRFIWLSPRQRSELGVSSDVPGSGTAFERSTTAAVSAGLSGRDLGSIRVLNGSASPGRGNQVQTVISADIAERFDLTFLTRRDNNFLLERRFLFYSPVPQSDPFSDAENPGAGEPSRYDVISQREYYDSFGLKGIPALRLPAEPQRYAPEPVPEISTAEGRRGSRMASERARIVADNARRLAAFEEYQAARDRQKQLFAGAVPPDECPPDRYEGNTPRQPGEPLPDQARPTQQGVEATYRSRE